MFNAQPTGTVISRRFGTADTFSVYSGTGKHHRLIHIDRLRCQPAEAKRKGATAMLLGSPACEGQPAYCTHSHVVSAHGDWPVIVPLRAFPLIKAMAHAYCKIRMHHIVKQRNILVSGKISGKQCQSWFYLDINDNLRYFNICPRLCVQFVLSSSKTAFYEIAS